jgi:N-acetylneuraminic acid mutarotase
LFNRWNYGEPGWARIQDMNMPRAAHSATLLFNGTVLVAGGEGDDDRTLNSAELYVPHSGLAGTWRPTDLMNKPRAFHTATLLYDGRVLVTGGRAGGMVENTAEIYDPNTGKWSPTANMEKARTNHSAVLLKDGKVLVVGGEGPGGVYAAAEVYEPTTGRWFSTSALGAARTYFTSLLLPDGRALVIGGKDDSQVIGRLEAFQTGPGR